MYQFIAFMILSIISVCSFADTAVYWEKVEHTNFLRASINDVAEAKLLYEGLNVKETKGRSGSQKTYESTGNWLEITCTKSDMPIGLSYTCLVSLKEGSTRTKASYLKDGFLVNDFKDETDATELYEAVSLLPNSGPVLRNGMLKEFLTKDKKVEIRVTKFVDDTVWYQARVSIQVPPPKK